MAAGPRLRIALLACGLGSCVLASAAAPAAEPEAQDGAPPPPSPVALDKLLELPADLLLETRRVGGATPAEWRQRFREARREVQRAEAELAASQRELEELASDSGQWQVSAPGAPTSSAGETPLSFKLSQQIRRQREEVERSKERLREVEIEANLAGVPQEWRD